MWSAECKSEPAERVRAQQADQARDGICRARTGPPLQQLLLLLGGSVDLLPGRALASPGQSLATFDPSQNINTWDQWQHQSKEINVLLAVFTSATELRRVSLSYLHHSARDMARGIRFRAAMCFTRPASSNTARAGIRHEALPVEHEAIPRANWPRSTDHLLNDGLKSTNELLIASPELLCARNNVHEARWNANSHARARTSNVTCGRGANGRQQTCF